MNSANEGNPSLASAPAATGTRKVRERWFLILTLVLVAAFSPLLWKLVRYAAVEETVSHVLLVPFICAYLVGIQRGARRAAHPSSSDLPAQKLTPSLPPFIFGLFALVGYWIWGRSGQIHANDALALSTLSFYCFFIAIALSTLGWQTLRAYRFALVFLAFMIPLPLFVTNGLSVALQHASADASDFTMRLTGMPVYRDGLGFQLPGLRIFVAEECSGIRSTLVLFITSLLAAHLFLRTRWKKIAFVLCVFPIGVFRNALRITAISWLTVNVDSGIIDSAFHHRGGPLFFVLSLLPLFALLWWFRKSDRRSMALPSSKSN